MAKLSIHLHSSSTLLSFPKVEVDVLIISLTSRKDTEMPQCFGRQTAGVGFELCDSTDIKRLPLAMRVSFCLIERKKSASQLEPLSCVSRI